MQENSISFAVAKFLNNLNSQLGTIMDNLDAKTKGLNLDSIIPNDMSLEQVKKFLDANISRS